jgi:cation diffusion facilitator family transporter
MSELRQQGMRTTVWSLSLNALLAATKLVVAIFASSQALLADGIHSLVDIASDIAVLIGLQFSHLPKDEDHPYGHHRFSTLATFLISGLVILFCLGLAWTSLTGLMNGTATTVPGIAAAWVAALSLILKESFYHYARRQAKRLGSSLLMASATDHRADAVGSFLALIAVLLAHYSPSLVLLDKVVGLVLAGWLGAEGIRLFKGACNDFMDTAPAHAVLKDLSEHIFEVPGAKGFHAFRARRLGDRYEVDFHLQVEPTATVAQGHEIASQIKATILRLHPEVIAVLIHIEPDVPEHHKPDGHHGRQIP